MFFLKKELEQSCEELVIGKDYFKSASYIFIAGDEHENLIKKTTTSGRIYLLFLPYGITQVALPTF